MEKIPINKKLKIACLMLAAVAMCTVVPTLAWLSASTNSVINYFSYGAIALTMDEAKVGTDGQALTGDDAARVQQNTYKYIAGAELDKDPTITVLKGSEACYVYACVDNELPDDLFSLNIDETMWVPVSSSGSKTIYRYFANDSSVVETSEEEGVTLEPVFTKITVSDSLTTDDINTLGTKKLTVTAFAIQSYGLNTDEADDLAEAYFYDGEEINALNANGTNATSAGGAEAGINAVMLDEENESEAGTNAEETASGETGTSGDSSTDGSTIEGADDEETDADAGGETGSKGSDTETEGSEDSGSGEEETEGDEGSGSGEAETGGSESSGSEETENGESSSTESQSSSGTGSEAE